MQVLCFGSLNIDYVYQVPHFVARGETLSSVSLTRHSGGKGLNQAIALRKAGLETHLAGAIGSDGVFLLEELRSAGVDTGHVKRLEKERTGHAVIQRTRAGENCILLYGGANQRITRQQIDETLSNFSALDLLVVQNEICELDYLVERARDKGMAVALNPSPMDDSLCRLLRAVDYLLLNEVEAGQLLSADPTGDARSMTEKLRKRYPAITVVLTLGERGALYAAQDGVFFEAALPVRAVDTTAAGDTFTGFFLAGLLSSRDPAWSMKYAATAAAIAVTRPGAAPSIPERTEVLARMAATV